MTTTRKKTTAKKTEPNAGATKIADGAREYVQRTAASARERTDSAYEGVSKFNSGLEKTMNRLVTGYVGILGEVADATRSNLVHAISTAEKVAQAKTLAEAAQIQIDFARDNATANYDRARNAVSATRDVVAEGVDAIREGVSGAWSHGQKAA
ncbi:hypothetical protein G5B40_12225 [Pikeienuella piscinae]|uniref:Phasin domain-containing protein n=1 Tax=Pikeienuella piscinae TaxID=2748098 RepID=A0A7L5C2Q9_9RHOB|nr:phasin family protein [Pikeienuella piscinae]QIE56159.1 hypothetical protein G5B40_12225 [Pikeienuella piscinae]